jgi:hypothetical protein
MPVENEHSMKEYPPEVADETRASTRYQFSLGSMLLVIAIACMAMWMFAMSRSLTHVSARLRVLEGEQTASRPLSAEEVARQFEMATNVNQLKTKVEDVRYSPEKDAYRVTFSWTDPVTKSQWSTDAMLKSDGFGVYFGPILSGEFLKAIGSKEDRYMVGVYSESPLKSK